MQGFRQRNPNGPWPNLGAEAELPHYAEPPRLRQADGLSAVQAAVSSLELIHLDLNVCESLTLEIIRLINLIKISNFQKFQAV